MTILVDFEIKTFSPYICYPSLQDFLARLDDAEPHCCWSERFLEPLTRMGVEYLDDIDLVTPECLYIFYRLPPVMIMDLFARILETIQTIHQSRPLVDVQNRKRGVCGCVHKSTDRYIINLN